MALQLNSPKWAELRTAYGSARDIPAILQALYERSVPDEVWEDLWSALCHQNDIYTATYAALPHIVAAARGRPVLEQASYFHFFAYAMACSARPEAPGLPLDLAHDFADALEEATDVALKGLRERPIDRETIKILCATVAAAWGDSALAIDFLEAGEELTCDECDASVPPHSESIIR
ncbi:MAG TPA: hypothetical protein VJ650_00495 [Gemmatimonadaceae bacterium]|nr:hypothetical protein [Gemmatimonadaceae bacterium]